MKAIIIGISSDIGTEIAKRLVRDGWDVTGTYRTQDPGIGQTYKMDVSGSFGLPISWDLLVFAVGTMEPIGRFWDKEPKEWEESLEVNAIAPLRLLRHFHHFRNPGASVCFFSGPMKPNPNLSAYRASKAFLTGMVEELDQDTDAKIFMLAPGVVNTKIHKQAGDPLGVYEGKVETTPHEHIYECLDWCIEQPKDKVGGKCVHVFRDPWRRGYLRAA